MRYILALIIAILWTCVALDRPTLTADFVRKYCPDAITDSDLEDCTGAHF
jgi:hypothetical protein